MSLKKILLVDDDEIFGNVLSKAIIKRNWLVSFVKNITDAKEIAINFEFSHAIIDLKMPGGSGLSLISELIKINPKIQIIILTGYASIATAVEAIKLGAIHYLAKPADTDEILASFNKDVGDTNIAISSNMSTNRLEWEYINKILFENNNNISKAAKVLGMHRRTLQRKLTKRPVNF
jgi:two-component system response regulator RegA